MGGVRPLAGAAAHPQDLRVDGAELHFFGSDSVNGAGLFVSGRTVGGAHVRGFQALTAMTVQNDGQFRHGALDPGRHAGRDDQAQQHRLRSSL